MPRPPRTSDTGPLPTHVALAVKDGLRELRFNLRHGAHLLAHRLESTGQLLEGADGPLAHLPKLGEPLGAAARTAVHWLATADHAAVDLLSSSEDYRRMDFRLMPVARYAAPGGVGAEQQRQFTKAYYWAVRHLLRLKGIGHVIVHEQAVHQALPGASPPALAGATGAGDVLPDHLVAGAVIWQLHSGQDPALLRARAVGASSDDGATRALALQCSAAAVLAGHLALLYPQTQASAETQQALTMADEIVEGCFDAWQQASRAVAPERALAQQLTATLRYA